jgi:restriction endonuclease S subunit
MQIKELFELHKGRSYFKEFIENPSSKINYVTTSGVENGVKCAVDYNENYTLFPAGTITVAMQGSVLSSFVQTRDFYLQTHVAALVPKQPLTLQEKIYYCLAIKSHAKEFNFGRKANRTIENLEIPSPDEIPSWVYEMEIPTFDDISEAKTAEKVELPSVSEWKSFKYSEIFELVKGRGPSATDAKHNPGNIPYVGASAENNGITLYSSHPPAHEGNVITIATDGSVGEAFYQKDAFNATSNIMVVAPRDRVLTASLAMFLITLIRQEKSKFNYGRKWGLNRMKNSAISLPVTENGTPNWQLMEDYINSLSYSKYL